MIRIGSAGWSYPDWDGIVYPARRSESFDPLASLASVVDCIEINSSFYRIPQAEAASRWVKRTAAFPAFLFTAKLWRGFTHESPAPAGDAAREAERAFREAMKPLRDAGRLGALLVQFPYSFHNNADNRSRLGEIVERFADFSVVVEVRHSSWLTSEFLESLRRQGVAFCNIDQPEISANIPPTTHVTSSTAYVRLHGRNSRAWFEEGAGRDRRYDYLYSAEELKGWAERIISMVGGARDIFVIANNHFGGQGIANALELKAIIAGAKVKAPPGVLEAFPRLRDRAEAAPAQESSAEGTDTSARSRAQGVLPF